MNPIPLEHQDFYIGREFWTATGRWRCTDVGTRTICAIKLDGDPKNWIGPPYAAAEYVFDENDLGGIYSKYSVYPSGEKSTGKRFAEASI